MTTNKSLDHITNNHHHHNNKQTRARETADASSRVRESI